MTTSTSRVELGMWMAWCPRCLYRTLRSTRNEAALAGAAHVCSANGERGAR